MSEGASTGTMEGRLRGQVLGGRYRLDGLLARGAMGVIYEAEDLVEGRGVAVKLLAARGEGARLRMQREIEAISSVEHPCIARVHSAGMLDERTPYLVLDRLHGETLGDFLRREGAMAAERALPLLLRCAGALEAAHRHGIVHRDVKPENLFLLGLPGAPEDVRVLDFGLSKGASRLTESGVAVGTAEYMAPEQALTDPVDGRADVYALGVVLFRVLAGRLPFEDRDKIRLMARQILEPAPALSLALPSGALRSGDLAALAAFALRKCPERRLPSMERFASLTGALLAGASLPPPGDLSTPDVYCPRSDFGRRVLGEFYRRLGRPVPVGVGEEEEEG